MTINIWANERQRVWFVVSSHAQSASTWQPLRDKREYAVKLHLLTCEHLDDTQQADLRSATDAELARVASGELDEHGHEWVVCKTCIRRLRSDPLLARIFASETATR